MTDFDDILEDDFLNHDDNEADRKSDKKGCFGVYLLPLFFIGGIVGLLASYLL